MTARAVGTEVLDDPHSDPAVVSEILTDLATLNRWLGGAGAVRHGLGRLIGAGDRGRTLTLFDIGTGAGDLPLDAVRWASKRGVTLRPIGLEMIRPAARMARDNGVAMIMAMADALPLRPASVDIVLISQVAHHLDRDAAVSLFAAATRVARRGVVVADLRTGVVAIPGFRIISRLLGMHRHTIEDGVTSLRRGYTRRELRAMCEDAGIADAHVVMRPGARLVASWRVA